MSGIRDLVCLWTLFLTHSGPVQCSATEFLARDAGDSVVLPCLVDQTLTPPIGVYLKRTWLRRTEVLFKYQHSEVSVLDSEYDNRSSVSGDPSSHALNVTLSELRPSDTDRYICEFHINNPQSQDITKPGKTDFLLFVRGDAPAVDRGWVHTCVGGSATLPCVSPIGDSSPVEGVILKRQRGLEPVEVLYHSKHSLSSSQFSGKRVQLTTAPGPGGISYNLTVQQLQPEDGGLYCCQLLLHGRLPSRTMGRRGVYVSVQGDQCGCSSYSALIYALSSAVGVAAVLILVVVVMYRGKQQRAVKAHTPAAPIYEEMSVLQPKSTKQSPEHLEETQSVYRNVSVKKPCPENHYERPNGVPCPNSE